jgi:hypothetical protein
MDVRTVRDHEQREFRMNAPQTYSAPATSAAGSNEHGAARTSWRQRDERQHAQCLAVKAVHAADDTAPENAATTIRPERSLARWLATARSCHVSARREWSVRTLWIRIVAECPENLIAASVGRVRTKAASGLHPLAEAAPSHERQPKRRFPESDTQRWRPNIRRAPR